MLVNWDNVENAFKSWGEDGPFRHSIVDDFFSEPVAEQLEAEFLHYEDPRWFVYDNEIEHKKALNRWELFPPLTYRVFCEFYSSVFLDKLGTLVGEKLHADPGLNGGGWHIHGAGGNLNPHLDYSIHPKLHLERCINIIVYLSAEMRAEHGGHLGLWSHSEAAFAPKQLEKEIQPKFNRAVIFDTTQNSWHGMSKPLSVTNEIFRKSLAVYYLRVPSEAAADRGRALFAPRDEQKNDPKVLELISNRSDVDKSHRVYKSGQFAD